MSDDYTDENAARQGEAPTPTAGGQTEVDLSFELGDLDGQPTDLEPGRVQVTEALQASPSANLMQTAQVAHQGSAETVETVVSAGVIAGTPVAPEGADIGNAGGAGSQEAAATGEDGTLGFGDRTDGDGEAAGGGGGGVAGETVEGPATGTQVNVGGGGQGGGSGGGGVSALAVEGAEPGPGADDTAPEAPAEDAPTDETAANDPADGPADPAEPPVEGEDDGAGDGEGDANAAPVADDATGLGTEDTTFSGVLTASDPDAGDTLTFALGEVVPPEAGTFTSFDPATGAYTFEPAENFNGDVTFTFTVTDSAGNTDTGTVDLDFAAVNDAPVADDIALTGHEDQPEPVTGKIAVTDVDNDSHTFSLIPGQEPEGGTVTIADDGTFAFVPDPDFNGRVEFPVRVTDADGASDTAMVTIDIAPDAEGGAIIQVTDQQTGNPNWSDTDTVQDLRTDIGETDTYTGDDFTADGMGGRDRVTTDVAQADDGQLTYTVTLDSGWNSIKAVNVEADDAANVTVADFVDAYIDTGASDHDGDGRIDGVEINVIDAKRGEIDTDAGDDTVTVESQTNGPNWGNTFKIDTHAGDDTVTVDGSQNAHGTVRDDMPTQTEIDLGAGNDVATLTGSTDTVYAGQGDDVVDTGAGDDIVYGGTGDDTVLGGQGDDVLDGGQGDDLLYGGAGDDVLIGDTPATAAEHLGEHGSMTLPFDGVGMLNLTSMGNMPDGEGHVWRIRNPSDEPVEVEVWNADGGFSETFTVPANSDFMFVGTEGTFTIENGGHAVTKASRDHMFFDGGAIETAGCDTLFGGAGNDTAFGGVGNDVIDGGQGDDVLTGGAGDDVLIGDSAVGLADHLGAHGPVVLPFDGVGMLNLTSMGNMPDDEGHIWRIRNPSDQPVEVKVWNVAGGFSETFMVPANSDFMFVGTEGTFTIENGSHAVTKASRDHTFSADWTVEIAGGDTLFGGAGDDTAFGGTGNDSVFGGQGDDLLYGGAGDDVLSGDGSGSLADQLGEHGSVTIPFGGEGQLNLTSMGNMAEGEGHVWRIRNPSDEPVEVEAWNTSGGFSETFTVPAHSDLMFVGTEGTFKIDDGTRDVSKASGGHTFSGGADVESAGADTLFGGAGDDTAFGGAGDDLVDGGSGADLLVGGTGDDWIYGGSGDDSLIGGAGNDTLEGGVGDDRMDGGSGDDLFTFDLGDFAAPQTDWVDGGSGTDTIRLEGLQEGWTVEQEPVDPAAGLDAESVLTVLDANGEDVLTLYLTDVEKVEGF